MSTVSSNYVQKYQGPTSLITFNKNEKNELRATIETKRLKLQPVNLENVKRYAEIYSNKTVMKKYLDGEPKDNTYIIKRITTLVERWQKNDPYSGFEVCEIKTGTILGLAFIGHSEKPGTAVIGGLGDDDYWKQGYGTETAKAIVHEYSLATVEEGYTLDGKVLSTITGTARKDNEGSWKIMQNKLDMKTVPATELSDRCEFSIDLTDIKEKVIRV